jgi:uncharacterized Fe-S cluster protein YjdI
MENVIKHYTNEEITIVWKSGLCQHVGNCGRGLRAVFNPDVRPWINPQGATTQEIINQIGQCPSGALSYFYNADK